MDTLIAQLGQDLARAGYAKRTQARYLETARRLRARCGCDIGAITREQLREFVDEVMRREASTSTKSHALCALRFLYARTLGTPEMVSFFRLPRKHSPLPTV
ncbi:MAG: phage integrase N-terminal SAM-like domain-containing protein, partial [Myxococcales bacterium]|nr:phage integrase N-terminal SAM-like domain-containing protein [Myxococcales bacterium]